MHSRDLDYERAAYKAFRSSFFSQCFLACIRRFTKDDGLDYNIIVSSNIVNSPHKPPQLMDEWTFLKQNDDEVVVRVCKKTPEQEQDVVSEFRYKIKDYLDGYDESVDSILLVFEKMASDFEKQYKGVAP